MRTLTPPILKEIDRRMDKIVELAEKTLKETRVYEKALSRTQLSNLLSLANKTDSVKALELFIKYQMGRDKDGISWRYPKEKPFGDRVIQDFQTLDKWAEEITITKKSGSEYQKEIHLRLIRLYVGSLNRWFVALKGGEEGEEEE